MSIKPNLESPLFVRKSFTSYVANSIFQYKRTQAQVYCLFMSSLSIAHESYPQLSNLGGVSCCLRKTTVTCNREQSHVYNEKLTNNFVCWSTAIPGPQNVQIYLRTQVLCLLRTLSLGRVIILLQFLIQIHKRN